MRAAEIAGALAVRPRQLAPELLPGGHREGHGIGAPGDVLGSPGLSLGVHLTGSKRGIWCDFSTGRSPIALDLI